MMKVGRNKVWIESNVEERFPQLTGEGRRARCANTDDPCVKSTQKVPFELKWVFVGSKLSFNFLN